MIDSDVDDDIINEKACYISVSEEDGDNYREISQIMTEIGFTMNHSSVRNYCMRIMQKFAQAFLKDKEYRHLSCDEKILEMARNPQFTSFISDLLHFIELQKTFK